MQFPEALQRLTDPVLTQRTFLSTDKVTFQDIKLRRIDNSTLKLETNSCDQAVKEGIETLMKRAKAKNFQRLI